MVTQKVKVALLAILITIASACSGSNPTTPTPGPTVTPAPTFSLSANFTAEERKVAEEVFGLQQGAVVRKWTKTIKVWTPDLDGELKEALALLSADTQVPATYVQVFAEEQADVTVRLGDIEVGLCGSTEAAADLAGAYTTGAKVVMSRSCLKTWGGTWIFVASLGHEFLHVAGSHGHTPGPWLMAGPVGGTNLEPVFARVLKILYSSTVLPGSKVVN
jgi:hypothetical protein